LGWLTRAELFEMIVPAPFDTMRGSTRIDGAAAVWAGVPSEARPTGEAVSVPAWPHADRAATDIRRATVWNRVRMPELLPRQGQDRYQR
jgi:hypothetical protein